MWCPEIGARVLTQDVLRALSICLCRAIIQFRNIGGGNRLSNVTLETHENNYDEVYLPETVEDHTASIHTV